MAVLITFVASLASVALAITVVDTWHAISAEPWAFASFLAVALALQLASVEVYGRGAISFGGTGLLALGFTFGAGPAMSVAVVAALINSVRRRAPAHRGVFDAAQWTLAAGAGAAFYGWIDAGGWTAPARLAPATAAGAIFMAVNIGLLCVAMSISERTNIVEVWKERFRWFTPYYLASGPLALALTIAYAEAGTIGLLAFALPPAMMMFSVRQYLARTRQSVEEVRQANEELQERNRDLRDLFQFASGLAARAHDRASLVSYVEESLERLTGARVGLLDNPDAGHAKLVAADREVASLHLEMGSEFDAYRWERLRDAILPQVATAVESADLIDRVRKQHLATIAALSRSMEAKDYYTGGHTERVSEIAVALASRLGYSGADLSAIEIGALLHDIGKIGIPERILQKPGPLDDDEWKVMKEHPIISEYILSEVDLPDVVRQIARSSHERMDGRGYPDGKKGEEIPLPARIVLVADAFDAMTSDRPYRKRRHVLAAIEELRAHSGRQFCPKVVEALELVYKEEPHILGAGILRALEVA